MLRTLFGTVAGRLALGFLILILAIVAWILISPIFIDRTVSEDFPIVDAAVAPAETEVATADAADAEGATMADTEVSEPMPASPVLISQGQFEDADPFHQGSGDVALYNLDGERVLRFEDFAGTNGPDLFVWLTNVGDPKADKGQIADEGNWVNLGRLKGNVGDQNYSVPADVNLDEFKHVVIWCRAFGVLFSSATLSTI